MSGKVAGLNFVHLSAVSDFLNTEAYLVQIAFIQGGSLPLLKPGLRFTSVSVSKTDSGIAIMEL